MVSFYILTMVKKGQYNVSMVLLQHNWLIFLSKEDRHDFRGNVVAHLQVVDELEEKRVTETHRAEWRYTLDHADRVSHTALSVDGGTFTPIQTTEFDGLGRVKKLAIGPAAVRYGYNVRSNLTGINSDVFSQTLYYGSNPEVTDYATYTGQVVASTTQ